MSEAFKTHLETLRSESADANELAASLSSSQSLLAYSEVRGLGLSFEDAERAADAYAGRLNDSDLENVSGGHRGYMNEGSGPPPEVREQWNDIARWFKNLF